MLKYHIYKYYLNAQHSFNSSSQIHGHTFTIALYIQTGETEEFVAYGSVEETVQKFLAPLEGIYLNENQLFQGVSPTIENMGDIFYERLHKLLGKQNVQLLQLEVSENPLQIYAVSDRILLPGQYGGDNRERWDRMLEQKRRYLAVWNKNEKGGAGKNAEKM